jgi:HAD superfamily hydrolase (TIGR01549 family)
MWGAEAMSRPGVILDLDGTLVDSVYQRVDAWFAALDAMGMCPPRWWVHRRIGMGVEAILAQLRGKSVEMLSGAEIRELKHRYLAGFRARTDTVMPLPGAHRLLATLRIQEASWAIATTTTTSTARALLGRLGENGADIVLVTGDDVAAVKPDPALVEEAAARLGLAPDALWMIGDSVWDVLAARRCGVRTAAVLTGGIGREELAEAGAELVYTDLDQLLDDGQILQVARSPDMR